MTVQDDAPGTVKIEYVPAGTSFPPTFRSPVVVRVVAAFAPVRHSVSYGTTSPHTARSRAPGLA